MSRSIVRLYMFGDRASVCCHQDVPTFFDPKQDFGIGGAFRRRLLLSDHPNIDIGDEPQQLALNRMRNVLIKQKAHLRHV